MAGLAMTPQYNIRFTQAGNLNLFAGLILWRMDGRFLKSGAQSFESINREPFALWHGEEKARIYLFKPFTADKFAC
jgi:hypothetical protein